MALSAALPWAASGRRSRSSFALFSLAERLELATGGVAAVVAKRWALVPALALVAVALHLLRYRTTAAVVAFVAAAVTLSAVDVVRRSPLEGRYGLTVTAIAAAFTIVAAAAELMFLFRPSRHSPEEPGHD